MCECVSECVCVCVCACVCVSMCVYVCVCVVLPFQVQKPKLFRVKVFIHSFILTPMYFVLWKLFILSGRS